MTTLKIDNISLSDYQIKDISINEESDKIRIISEASIRISDSIKFGETVLIIKKWKKLRVSKYIQEKPFDKGIHYEIDCKKKLEKFELIQILDLKDKSTLILEGYIKNKNGWLTYIFNEFECEIKAKK